MKKLDLSRLQFRKNLSFLFEDHDTSWMLMSVSDSIAPPESLLGQLQRGRGKGYLRILKESPSDAHELLLKCITQDPRMDSQVEDRSHYYAAIAIDIGLATAPLAEHLKHHDDQGQNSNVTTLTVTILTELAIRNHPHARDILYDYIRWGQWWNWPLDDLLDLSNVDLLSGVSRSIEQRFPTDAALDEALSWRDALYEKLAIFSPRIAESLKRLSPTVAPTSPPDPLDPTSLPLEELLAFANRDNHLKLGKFVADMVKPSDLDLLISHVTFQKPFSANVALAGLAKLVPPSLSDWLSELWLKLPERRPAVDGYGWVILRQAITRTFLSLPAEETLPLARLWISNDDWRKKSMAEDLLQQHATVDDLPLLRTRLQSMLVDEDAEWRCFLIKAFHHLPDIGVIPELVDIFHHFRFSMGRAYAAEAIQVTSPEFFKNHFAFECLWDCEERTRELGIRHVDLKLEEARRRISYLAHDPLEDEDVRQEAQRRFSSI